MKLHLAAVFAALVLCGVAHAIPPSVMTPYQAYLAAIEGEDFAGAAGHADAAYQAGVAAQIDTDTLAALAENRAQAYTFSGDLARAAPAWGDLADVMERAGTARDDRAWALVMSAAAYLRGEDYANAERRASAATALYQSGEGGEHHYAAQALLSTSHFTRQQLREAGRAAAAALSIRETLSIPANAELTRLAFSAGIARLLERDRVGTAYYIALAAESAEAAAADNNETQFVSLWARYTRERLSASEREELFERVAASPLFASTWATRVEADEQAQIAERNFDVDAVPVSRRPPRYPATMQEAGVEGIAVVRFDVDENGRPSNIEVPFSIPHPDFGRNAQDAVRRWTYTPAMKDGRPVRREGVQTQFEFAFQ